MEIGIEAESITAGMALKKFNEKIITTGVLRGYRAAAGVVKTAAESSTAHGDLTGMFRKSYKIQSSRTPEPHAALRNVSPHAYLVEEGTYKMEGRQPMWKAAEQTADEQLERGSEAIWKYMKSIEKRRSGRRRR